MTTDPGPRVAVAMSGGVDSSVAAALLAEHGYSVVGLSMQLYDQRAGDQTFGSCCSLDDLHDARRVAHALGLPHYILNLEREFQAAVIDNFVDEYARGRTPIPCTRCNTDVKFATLLERARGFGAEQVATGHYARVTQLDDGQWALWRGADLEKDQSYFLFGLTQSQLGHTMFPVGDLSKSDVRAHARRLGLRTAEKPDSQEICFVPDGDYAAFVARRRGVAETAGPIVDQHGTTIGGHSGVHRFTIGQRRGLGLSTGVPLYVTAIDAREGSVTVGPRHMLEGDTLRAASVNWIAGVAPVGPQRVLAQIRHRHVAAPAQLLVEAGGMVAVTFDAPQTAITPGQAVVFYDGARVLGGGWITA